MSQRNIARSLASLLADGLFIPLAFLYALAAAAFGCSGSVSVNSGGGGGVPVDPNRALGTYEIEGLFGEAESQSFFGYWFDGNNNISTPAAQAFRAAMIPIENAASVTIVPSSILYEETAVSLNTGQLVTVSISGTWSYDGQTRIRVNWGSAFVTASTFPSNPPFDVATVGTFLDGPNPGDIIFANNINWIELTSVEPGPFNGVFIREVQ